MSTSPRPFRADASEGAGDPSAPPAAHTTFDDAQGIAFGAVMAAVGVAILTHLGLVTGPTAGLAVLLSYATKWSFGAVFFAVNLPFYWLGAVVLNLVIAINHRRDRYVAY